MNVALGSIKPSDIDLLEQIFAYPDHNGLGEIEWRAPEWIRALRQMLQGKSYEFHLRTVSR